jgi:hypothetical protein
VRTALLVLAACHTHVAVPATTAELSKWTKTGRYDEAVAQCHAFANAYANVSCDEIGRTGEGRPIVAVRAGKPGKPVIYVQGGIHAGEIEGKDAGFWFLRDLLDGKVAPGALDRVGVIFVPVINPDGHERFGAHNRPNQRGPEEMGFRTNGERQNLNRDFVKADTPEVQAVLGVYKKYDPVLLVDIHTTDGAKFEPDISITVGPRAPRGDHLDATAVALGDALAADMTARGHLPVTFYPSFIKDDDPMSGFVVGEAPPRFSQVYAGTRGRLGILVENHSWKTYEHRVRATYDFLLALFTHLPGELPAPEDLRGKDLVVVWDNGPHTTTIPFRGYVFERHPSEITGATAITYDESKPEVWNVPLYDEMVPKVTTRVPRAGYVVDGGYAALVARVLDAHGIRYQRIAGEPSVAVEAFRATKVTTQPLFEGRARMAFEGAWAPETRALDRGALFVPTDQPLARLAVHLLDPAAPDSLAQWGELATAFERKEYIESYVVEEAGRAMLARDPALRARFEAALADPAFAKNAQARQDWFYKLMPSWDERLNLLPIYRADVAPPVR